MGDKSGMKCDPEDVSAKMRIVRDKKGVRVFSVGEFLSAAQIASYFSRLCMQKKKKSGETLNEEDFEAAEVVDCHFYKSTFFYTKCNTIYIVTLL